MRFLHVMLRVKDLNKSLAFYCDILGLQEVRRKDFQQGRFTLIYLAAPMDKGWAEESDSPLIELTYNWDPEQYEGGRNFGHIAFEVEDIYAYCDHLMKKGVILNRPPRDGYMAFIRSPDQISIEILQKNEALPVTDPWQSMPNKGEW